MMLYSYLVTLKVHTFFITVRVVLLSISNSPTWLYFPIFIKISQFYLFYYNSWRLFESYYHHVITRSWLWYDSTIYKYIYNLDKNHSVIWSLESRKDEQIIQIDIIITSPLPSEFSLASRLLFIESIFNLFCYFVEVESWTERGNWSSDCN